MRKIGYLGLGVMGQGMASNLIRKNDGPIYGFDPVPQARERFTQNGGCAVETAQELYRTCEVIFLCLPSNALVESTVREILQCSAPGTIVVDMGSTSPYVIRRLHQEAKERDIHLLDSPVSGGKTGADAGTLAIMCGGEREVFEEVKPYLEMMGKTVTHMGASGCGSTAKLANNMMVGIHLAAMGEAFAFARKAGIEPEVLFGAIKDGFAKSAVMDLKMPEVLKHNYEPTARIAVHLKDINNALEMAEHLDVDIPMTKIVKQQMDWIDAHGMINEDQCALVKYYEDAMDVMI